MKYSQDVYICGLDCREMYERSYGTRCPSPQDTELSADILVSTNAAQDGDGIYLFLRDQRPFHFGCEQCAGSLG